MSGATYVTVVLERSDRVSHLVHTYTDQPPIAAVTVDGVKLQAADPEQFERVAREATAAAALLRLALRERARQVQP